MCSYQADWTWARGRRTCSGWHHEVPGAPEQPAGVTDVPGPHGAGCVLCTHDRPTPPPLPKPPSASRLAQVWCICGPLAAFLPAVLGAVRLKAGWLDLIPHVSCFISLSLPYTASVCFYKYFTSLAKVYFISLLNLLNINAATTLP